MDHFRSCTSPPKFSLSHLIVLSGIQFMVGLPLVHPSDFCINGCIGGKEFPEMELNHLDGHKGYIYTLSIQESANTPTLALSQFALVMELSITFNLISTVNCKHLTFLWLCIVLNLSRMDCIYLGQKYGKPIVSAFNQCLFNLLTIHGTIVIRPLVRLMHLFEYHLT
jgi:hypothetical protein